MTDRFSIHRRFAWGLAAATAGAFLAIVSGLWATGTIEWIGFAVGVGALMGGVGMLMAARGPMERGLDLLVAALGAWTIIASFAYDGGTRLDLARWEGVALALLGAAAMVVHERTTERVVHQLEVTTTEREDAPAVHH